MFAMRLVKEVPPPHLIELRRRRKRLKRRLRLASDCQRWRGVGCGRRDFHHRAASLPARGQ
jgi:hypothetical protein